MQPEPDEEFAKKIQNAITLFEMYQDTIKLTGESAA